MRLTSSERITGIAIELAWLLGSWAFSFVVLGALIGFDRLIAGPLDIQMHNTYFVLSPGYATFPVFLVVATAVTVARGLLARFNQKAINRVLTLLGLAWALLLLAVFALLKNAH